MTQVEKEVKRLLSRVLHVEEGSIRLNDDLNMVLGLDYPALLQIGVYLQQQYGLSLSDGELERLNTVNDLIRLLRVKGRAILPVNSR